MSINRPYEGRHERRLSSRYSLASLRLRRGNLPDMTLITKFPLPVAMVQPAMGEGNE